MTAFAYRYLRRIVAPALAVLSLGFIASCGSGAVSDSSGTGGSAITINPSSATLYSDLPTTFLLSGGNGSYVITSNNQAVIGVTGVINGNTLTVVPNGVSADTTVTLTVTDTQNHAPASATLTVKPRTISNVVTVTPSASQSAECGTAVCSGGDAEVKFTLTQNGVPLSGRPVRFDVLSGDVRIITSAPGSSESLSTSGTATTDSTGTARIRIRVLSAAPAQTALIQATDVSSGFTQTTAVSVAPSSNAPLTVRPTSIQFTGPTSTACASGVSADIVIIGGRPPYQVTQPPGFTVSPLILGGSGGRVTVTATGQCARTGTPGTSSEGGQTIAIVDSNGATASVVVHNDPAPSAVQSSPFAVGPSTVTLDTCQSVATVALAGGTGTYMAASGNSAVAAYVSGGNVGVIQRTQGTPQQTPSTPNPVPPSPITVSFSDGQSVKDVTVTLTGTAAQRCP